MENTLSQLSSLMEQITQKQGSIALHAQNIQLAVNAGLDDEANGARELMTMFVATPADVWLPFLAAKENELADTMDGVKEIHELYQRAEQDYLSIPLLIKHMDFIMDHQDLFALAASGEDDDDADETSTTRQALQAIAEKAGSHLTQGHEVWDKWRDWELQLLESDSSPEQVNRLDAMFMARLQAPHSTHEETAQAYSTFNSTYRPSEDYEKLMIAVTKARSAAVKAWNARETGEISLKNASFSLDAYAEYLKDELRRLSQATRAPPPLRKGRKAPARNVQDEILARALARALHERAISAAASAVFANPYDTAAQTHLRNFWTSYAASLRNEITVPRVELGTLYRSTRSVPGSGDAWARYLRALERHAEVEGPKESVEEAFGRALEAGMVQDSAEEIVPLVQARADYERRRLEAGAEGEEASPADRLVSTLEGGIELVRKASKEGDTRLRLERYLSSVYEEMDDMEKAFETLESAAKAQQTSYVAWSEYLRLLGKADADKARTVFRDVAAKNLDWPEMLWEQWIQFEHVHGSVEDVEECLSRVHALNEKLVVRRAKEAEAYQSQYAATTTVIQEAQVDAEAMQVDAAPEQTGSVSRKRKAEDDANDVPSAGDPTKRVKIDETSLKRDRENSTVLVAELQDGTDEAALRQLFKDCGEIREVKVTPLPSGPVATVEFMSRDSVPAALTRDKKRIAGHEIAVHAVWRSTLYVTNFPEETDDAAMRNLFGEFGIVLDVRWPSKKFKSSRRFCYVQYTSPAAAEKSLCLHGRELAPGMSLSVLISDPTRKKERSDADANEREVYIAGLSRFTKRGDIETLFKQFGAIKDVRMSLDDKGHSKGFAFVEFAESRSAHSALTANNYELKSRRIAVTLADPRVRAKHKHDATGLGRKAGIKSRSVRLRGLPPATQEGLLQQALEKEIQGVKRVEVFVDLCEAVVELESQQVVGALLLRATPIVFQDHELSIVEDTGPAPGPKKPAAAASTSTAPAPAPTAFLPRGIISRPRAGLGSKKRVGATAVSAGAGIVSKATADAPMETDASTSTSAAADGAGKGQDDFRKMLGL
ncbi:hypothetical protein EXIGLDRAFT_845875 [Exidia glandulosa HHB12029]|uniref:U4/U6 snRNA-associated-splicing factor PRP24 n=1 Tax=Exidia glandulosa HHB12029 TaxID=1314781 RepID=A0A165Z7I6_EXIGL|nr:hypothetical protein EXIGLDRAFT_845875 [Exidia glandulosa HHB12029]